MMMMGFKKDKIKRTIYKWWWCDDWDNQEITAIKKTNEITSEQGLSWAEEKCTLSLNTVRIHMTLEVPSLWKELFKMWQT